MILALARIDCLQYRYNSRQLYGVFPPAPPWLVPPCVPLGKRTVLRSQVLEKIIELQTHEPSQFEELGLPLAIKRLAWEKDAKLFVRIASPYIDKYISSEYAPKMIAASQQVSGAGRGRGALSRFCLLYTSPSPRDS